MIELLLQAERALSVGLLDQADRLYRQAVDADPRNSIAVVGLARVALERGDEAEAWRQARRAQAIDPENVAAQRLVDRLGEVFAERGDPLPSEAPEPVAGPPSAAPTPPDAAPQAPSPSATSSSANSPGTPATAPARPPSRGLVDRLLRRRRR